MSQGRFKYVYGPVASRRLGRSLGVDLVPFKTCSYDCIYCQLGRTTDKTIKLDEYVPMDGVLAELGDKLKEGPRPDFVGLAGSGEPTLHVRLGEIIAGVKMLTDVPVAVLTNGSLLWKPEVRASLAQANLVMPSLDAGTPSSFVRVNRPHADISFEQMVDGLLTFSHEFKGKVWLEVLLLARISDRRDEVERIAAIVDKMRIDRVQLNTASRPPADASALTVATDGLERLRGLFSCPCEVIAETRQSQHVYSSRRENIEDHIVALLSRRPCTVEGIATGLGLRPNEVLKHLDVLCANGSIRAERKGEAVFYEGVHKRP
jgi:wyosine [tRNA(Phe)-imidazoG37] synthetase (radical SAM superfamily)